MKFSDFSTFFSFLSPAVLTAGVIIGWVYKKSLDKIHKSLTFYLLLMLCLDLSARILGKLGNNFIILLVYSLIDLCFFLYLYNKLLLKKYNKIFLITGVIGIAYIVGEIFYFFILNKLDAKQFQPYSKVVDNFIVVLMALAFYLERISNFKESHWNNFVLNTVLLVFFTITLIVFLPFNFLVNEKTGLKFYFFHINIVMIIALYMYLTYSVWKNGRQQNHNLQKKITL
ncbi:hypothetical protein AAEO56_14180 [Flavobacterium sp. DGU11]|uniref:YhhN-like protein n=1 Tax=Flavobacterium arundinis TaxID=3139143 RepID=A0ABU9HZ25_9FLAO